MKKSILFFSIWLFTVHTQASELGEFLESCGYGTLIGAGIGVVSLAFEKNPSDHANNIAKGASLGLYGGIAYGIVKINEKPKEHELALISKNLYGVFYSYNY